MCWLDIAIIIAVSIPVMIGFRRGFVQTAVPLAGAAVAIILGVRFYSPLASGLSSWIDSPTQCDIAAFAIIFVLVIGAALLLSSLLRKVLCLVLMGWVDNASGAALGLAIGGMVVALLLTLAIRLYPSGAEDAVRDSQLATFLLDSFTSVLPLLSEEWDSVRHVVV
jgi:uncharacterized membrane protein required for colicin V production